MKLDVDFNECVNTSEERLGKDGSYQLDSSKIRSDLGWKDNINLNDGIDSCINWIKENFDILQSQPLNYIHKP